MSDGYAWFGAAYFIYDLWHMYRVHTHKVNDKILLSAAAATSIDHEIVAKTEHGHNNNDRCDMHASDYSYSNDIIERNMEVFVKRLRNVSSQHINFIQFCLVNPVMIVHHVFLGSFGLFVIVVSSTANCNFQRIMCIDFLSNSFFAVPSR